MPTIERVGAGDEAHALELAEHALASAREAEPRAGEDEAEERDRLQRLARRHRLGVGEGSAGPGVEEVDRHFAGVELGELEREVDPLFERLAHAEDPTAAQLHARVAREEGGRDAIVVAVGRADLREQLAARFEVVVVAADARGREPFGLLGLQQPE